MEELDINFYIFFYDDLKDLKTSNDEVYQHYLKQGIHEKRIPNVFKLIEKLKEIKFDVIFYKKLKKLEVEDSCYQSVYVYKNYLKNLDFKNGNELKIFFKKKVDLNFFNKFFNLNDEIDIFNNYEKYKLGNENELNQYLDSYNFDINFLKNTIN